MDYYETLDATVMECWFCHPIDEACRAKYYGNFWYLPNLIPSGDTNARYVAFSRNRGMSWELSRRMSNVDNAINLVGTYRQERCFYQNIHTDNEIVGTTFYLSGQVAGPVKELPDGSLICQNSGPALSRSTNNGLTWTQVLAGGIAAGSRPFLASDGKLWICGTLFSGITARYYTYVHSSADNGATWSSLRFDTSGAGDIFPAITGPVPLTSMVWESGGNLWLSLQYVSGFSERRYFSADNGATWTSDPATSTYNVAKAAPVVMPSGKLLSMNPSYILYSTDNFDSTPQVVDIGLPSSVNNGGMIADDWGVYRMFLSGGVISIEESVDEAASFHSYCSGPVSPAGNWLSASGLVSMGMKI